MPATWSSSGRVSPRRKGPSKALRDRFGHTPLSAAEAIPWGGHRLIVGTGADGRLPIAADVHTEAERRGVGMVALPTAEACRLLAEMMTEGGLSGDLTAWTMMFSCKTSSCANAADRDSKT